MVVEGFRVGASRDVDLTVVHAESEWEHRSEFIRTQHEARWVSSVHGDFHGAAGDPAGGVDVEVVTAVGHAAVRRVVAADVIDTDEGVDVALHTGEVTGKSTSEDVAIEGVETGDGRGDHHEVILPAFRDVLTVAVVERRVRVVVEGLRVHAPVDRDVRAVAFPLEVGAGTFQLTEVVEGHGDPGVVIISANRLENIRTIARLEAGAVVDGGVRIVVRGFRVGAPQDEGGAIVHVDAEGRVELILSRGEGIGVDHLAIEQHIHRDRLGGKGVVDGHVVAAVRDAAFGDPLAGIVDAGEGGTPGEAARAHHRVLKEPAKEHGVDAPALDEGQRVASRAVHIVFAAAVNRGRGVVVRSRGVHASVGVDHTATIAAAVSAAVSGPVVVRAIPESDGQGLVVSAFQSVGPQFEPQHRQADGHFRTIPSVPEGVQHLQHVAAVLETGGGGGRCIALESVLGRHDVTVGGVQGPADFIAPQSGGGGDVGREEAVVLGLEGKAHQGQAEEKEGAHGAMAGLSQG